MCFGGAAILARDKRYKQHLKLLHDAYKVLSKVNPGETPFKQEVQGLLNELEEALNLPRQMDLPLGKVRSKPQG